MTNTSSKNRTLTNVQLAREKNCFEIQLTGLEWGTSGTRCSAYFSTKSISYQVKNKIKRINSLFVEKVRVKSELVEYGLIFSRSSLVYKIIIVFLFCSFDSSILLVNLSFLFGVNGWWCKMVGVTAKFTVRDRATLSIDLNASIFWGLVAYRESRERWRTLFDREKIFRDKKQQSW